MLDIQNILINYLNKLEPSINQCKYADEKVPIKIETNFRLPISYLEKSKLFTLSDTVANDLELSTSLTGTSTMYDFIFQPQHSWIYSG